MKKFLSAKSSLLLIILLCILSINVKAAQYTICSAGCTFTTITDGLQNITGTDNTLNVNESGTYTNINITPFYVSLSANEPVIIITAENVVLDCSDSNIIGNTTGYGIIAARNNITIQNCWVENYTRGISVKDSSDGNIISNVITSCSYGLWISNTNTTTINSNSLISSDVTAIEFTNTAINNTVLNTDISGSALDLRSGGAGTSNFIINSSFNYTKLNIIDAQAEIIIGWFYKIYINDSSGSPVNNTFVNVTNTFSELQDSLTTDITGYTSEQPIPEYMLNSTGITQYVNYTIYAYNSTNFAFISVNISNSQIIALTFDITAPIISSIAASTTNSSALITWVTDDLSNATFEYGISSSILNLTSSSSTLSQAFLINITGLTSNITYYYNITSCNDQGICKEDGTYNFITNMTPDTTAPIISSLINTTTNQTAVITFNTDDMANASVKYGLTTALGSSAVNVTMNTGHYVRINSILSNTTYYYNITTCNAVDLCTENGPYSFITNGTIDTTAPVISSLINTTTNQTAVITFNTDDMANASVKYGLTTALGSSDVNVTMSTGHYVKINSILSNTTYYYNITTCNAVDLCTENGPYSFITNGTIDTTIPVISSITNTTGINQFIISWTTNKNSSSLVKYGILSGAYIYTATGLVNVTSHTVNISGLSESTMYYYIVNSTDESGNSVQSAEYSFITPDISAPIITFSNTNSSIISDWKNILLGVATNEVSTCIVTSYMLGTTTYPLPVGLSTSDNLTHTRYFNSTADSTGYNNYFTVRCTDTTGNYRTSTIYFKILDTTPPSISFLTPTPNHDGFLNNKTLIINLTVSETPYTDYPKIKVDSGTVSTMSSTSSTYTYSISNLAEGKHGFIVIIRDTKGNEINYTRNYTVDITKPEITVISPDGKTLKICSGLELNVSLKEDGTCEYELFKDDDIGYDRCIDRCGGDYDDCVADATTTAERTTCTNSKKECEVNCADDRYDSKKTGSLTQKYGLDNCYDECNEDEDNFTDDCKDAKTICYVAAINNERRDDCDDDYANCLDDSSDEKDDCYDTCDKDIEYLFFKDMENTCLDDSNYMVTFTCQDLSGNEKIENVSFEMLDTQAPIILKTEPNGTIDTSTVSIRVYTDEEASCRFSESDKIYSSMEYVLKNSGSAHSITLNNLVDGDHIYYVRCNDTRENIMASSAVIRFSVKATTITNKGTASKTFGSITVSTPALFEPDESAEVPVTKVEISVNENVQNAKISVTRITDISDIQKPADTAYKYIKIEKTGLTSTQMKSAIVKFKVEKTWLAQNGLDPNKVYLARYSSSWNGIETNKTSDDSIYYYYQVKLTDFSVFAIISKPVETIPAGETIIPKTEETKITPVQETKQESKNTSVDQPIELTKKGTSTWLWMLLLCVVVVGGGLAFLFVYKHRHPQQVLARPQIQSTQDSVAAAEESVAANFSIADMQIDPEYEKQIKDYISQCIDAGMQEKEIKKNLIDASHDASVIDVIYGKAKPDNIKKNEPDTAYEREVNNYIEQAENSGAGYDDIKKTLLDAGHNKADIDRIINEHKNKKTIESVEDKELIDYINSCFDDNISDIRIIKALIKAGHDETYVKVIVEKINKQRKQH